MVYKWIINNLSRFFGRYCQLCGQLTDPATNIPFCSACLHDLPRLQHSCHQCGCHINAGTEHTLDTSPLRCGPCLTQPPSFDRVIAAFAYADPIRQLMARFKYQRQLATGDVIAQVLRSRLPVPAQVEAIIPVPLHPRRLRQRGFNQALELSRPLARALDLPLLPHSVIRQKNTPPQSSLTRKQRRQNLKQAFSLKQAIPYASIAIVDDVMTTGSTVEALSTLLKQHGVEYIEVWCVARATGRS